ncbi:hypothetical protein, partial [Bacillus cereus group sp. BC10]|uniref:hypothetical protein n=1 Tax=Bacillus cereus group sp. BC10 TaxID=3445349 RepID=UPI003F69A704
MSAPGVKQIIWHRPETLAGRGRHGRRLRIPDFILFENKVNLKSSKNSRILTIKIKKLKIFVKTKFK